MVVVLVIAMMVDEDDDIMGMVDDGGRWVASGGLVGGYDPGRRQCW